MRVLGAQPMLTAAPRTRWRAAAIRSANGQPGASGPPRAPCHRGLSGRTGGRWRARGSRQEARPPLLSRCGRGGSGRGEGALGREARRGRPSEHALPEAGAAAVSLTSPRAPRPPRFRGKSGEEISALATGSREPAPALAPPPSPRPTLEEPVLAWRRPARKRPLVEATVGEASPSGPARAAPGNRRAGSERLGSARAAPSRSAPRRRREPAGTCAAEPSAPRSGPRLAGNAPRPAPSGDLQRLLASMQSSWGARRPLPGRPVQEHARPRPQGRPASLPRERKGLARRHSNAASGATRLVHCRTAVFETWSSSIRYEAGWKDFIAR